MALAPRGNSVTVIPPGADRMRAGAGDAQNHLM